MCTSIIYVFIWLTTSSEQLATAASYLQRRSLIPRKQHDHLHDRWCLLPFLTFIQFLSLNLCWNPIFPTRNLSNDLVLSCSHVSLLVWVLRSCNLWRLFNRYHQSSLLLTATDSTIFVSYKILWQKALKFTEVPDLATYEFSFCTIRSWPCSHLWYSRSCCDWPVIDYGL